MHQLTASPFFSESQTAHSGPELVDQVPNARLAHALASSLIADRAEIVERPRCYGVHDQFSDVTLKGL